MSAQVQRPDGDERRGSQALAESLQLQRNAQERAQGPAPKRGKRRKGDVIDLESRTRSRVRRHRIFLILLVVEALVAVVAVLLFISYVALNGEQLN